MTAGRKPKLNWTPCLEQYTTCIRGVRHRLGTDEAAAKERFDWLLREDGAALLPREANPFLGDLFSAWMAHTIAAGHHPERLRLCKAHLRDFIAWMGVGARIGELRASHVEKWVTSRGDLKPGTATNCKATILAALNWSAKPASRGGGELIPANPLRGRLKLPPGGSRGVEAVWTRESFLQVIEYSNVPFADVVMMLAWTGMRPSLLCRLEASHYNPQFSRFETAAITHARKKAIYIRLNRDAVALAARLAAKHPTGKLFRNTLGDPWREKSLSTYLFSMMHIFESTRHLTWQPGLCLKGLRHTFATAYLAEHPNEIEYLRELLGHRDYKMIFKHYGKLVDQNTRLNDRMRDFSPFHE